MARHEFAALIARAFDGALMVDGQRVVAHKSGMHVVRGNEQRTQTPARKPNDQEVDFSDV